MRKHEVRLGQLAEVRKYVWCSLTVRGFGPVWTGSPGSGPPPNLELDFGSGSAPMLNFGLDLGPVL